MIPAKFYTSILLILFFNILTAQSLTEYGSIGNFRGASSFHINPPGFIFVIDPANNDIIKLDTLGNVIKSIGGYGWDNLSFDDPTDVFTNTLNIYVADKNNDRIQIFDKDMNYLSSFSSKYIRDENNNFRYPTGVGVSGQGDFFILDSDNARILKFSFNGTFLTTIGSYDSGTFALRNPQKFTILPGGRILVIDNNELVIFDQFGNSVSKNTLNFNPVNINSTSFGITIVSDDTIYFSTNLNNYQLTEFALGLTDIKDALIFNSKIYVLTPESIHIFKFLSN